MLRALQNLIFIPEPKTHVQDPPELHINCSEWSSHCVQRAVQHRTVAINSMTLRSIIPLQVPPRNVSLFWGQSRTCSSPIYCIHSKCWCDLT